MLIALVKKRFPAIQGKARSKDLIDSSAGRAIYAQKHLTKY